MKNRNRKETHGHAHDTESPARRTSPLLQRLMDKLAGQREERERHRGAPASPAPPGSRSGSGADSVAPFLEETRNSRPAPLE